MAPGACLDGPPLPDCSPSLGILTLNALTAADAVLIPLQCETLSHRGVGQLLDTVHDVRRFTNRDLEVWGVLPTLYDGRTNHARTVLATISDTYDLEVVDIYTRQCALAIDARDLVDMAAVRERKRLREAAQAVERAAVKE